MPFSSAFSSLNCTRNRIPFEAFSYGFETIFVHSARCRQRIKCGHPLLIIPRAINHSTQNEKKNPKKIELLWPNGRKPMTYTRHSLFSSTLVHYICLKNRITFQETDLFVRLRLQLNTIINLKYAAQKFAICNLYPELWTTTTFFFFFFFNRESVKLLNRGM